MGHIKQKKTCCVVTKNKTIKVTAKNDRITANK